MKIYPERLSGQAVEGINCFLLWGDEPLIKQESTDWIRQQLQQKQCIEERRRFAVDNELSWAEVNDCFQALSLFSQSQLVELHFDKLPDKAQQQQLEALLPMVNEETRLLLSMPKLGKPQERQKWYQQLEKQGLVVAIYPPEGRHLQQWVSQRLQRYQLSHSADHVSLLVHYFEGNLLALDQAIQIVRLRWPDQQPSVEQFESCLSHANRFSAFQLADAMLAFDLKRCLLILEQLRLEGDEPTLINWTIERDLKVLQALQQAGPQQQATVFKKHGIWAKRQNLFNQALPRCSEAKLTRARLQVAEVDKAIKSFDSAFAWLELERLLLNLMSR